MERKLKVAEQALVAEKKKREESDTAVKASRGEAEDLRRQLKAVQSRADSLHRSEARADNQNRLISSRISLLTGRSGRKWSQSPPLVLLLLS